MCVCGERRSVLNRVQLQGRKRVSGLMGFWDRLTGLCASVVLIRGGGSEKTFGPICPLSESHQASTAAQTPESLPTVPLLGGRFRQGVFLTDGLALPILFSHLPREYPLSWDSGTSSTLSGQALPSGRWGSCPVCQPSSLLPGRTAARRGQGDINFLCVQVLGGRTCIHLIFYPQNPCKSVCH